MLRQTASLMLADLKSRSALLSFGKQTQERMKRWKR